MSFSFSGVAMVQSKGRLCRIGQQAKKVFTRYFCSNEFEAKCLALVLNKFKNVKMTLSGKEALGRDETVKILNIIKETWDEDRAA
jgi:hypothetical protein